MASAAGCSSPNVPDAVRADAVLDERADPALDPDGVGDDEHQHGERAQNLHRAEQRELSR